jgi:hypothetical protein
VSEEEYEKFMKYLYQECLQTRNFRRFRKHHHPMEWGYESDRLISASNLLRYINHHCQEEDEIYRTINRKRIDQLSNEIRDGIGTNRRMLEDSGFMDVFDSHYFEIVDGMKLEHMPQQEIQIMRELGSNDPESELSALMSIVKTRTKSNHSYNQEVKVSQQLKNIEEKLDQQQDKLKGLKEEADEQPKKSRRWFKGLGQIAQGSALSIANVGLAMGAITIPVATETASWGALVSSITGVGMVLNGVGEFRGE